MDYMETRHKLYIIVQVFVGIFRRKNDTSFGTHISIVLFSLFLE